MKYILKNFFLSRAIFIAFALVAYLTVPLREGYLGDQFDRQVPYLAWIWANFDGRHYLNIATIGYQHTNFSYFPLYPLLISVLQKIVPISPIYLGIVISSIAFLLAMVYLFRLVKEIFNQQIAKTTILLLSFFPLSFFYNAVYTDSVFLLFSICSFYYAHKRNWGLSGFFGMLTILTRLSGIALIPALAIELYMLEKDSNKKLDRFIKPGLLVLGLTALGLVIYMAYQQIFFGDMLLFQKSMISWNQNKFVFPLQVFYRYIKIFLSVDPHLLVYWVAVMEFVSLILYGLMALYVYKKVRKSYGVFMFVLLCLVPFTGTFAGTPRYGLHIFPLFLGLAIMFQKKKRLKKLILVVFLLLGLVLTGLFTRGYFIA